MGDQERRATQRFQLALRVYVEIQKWLALRSRARKTLEFAEETCTENISSGGCYFHLSRKPRLGAPAVLEISMPFVKRRKLRCYGNVIRVEPKDRLGKVGVACRIDRAITKRAMRKAFTLSFLFLPLAAYGQANRPFMFSITNSNFQWITEQQTPGGALANCSEGAPCVVNWTAVGSTEHSWWDADDQESYIGSGNLAAGDSREIRRWVLADWTPHMAAVRLTSSDKGGSFHLEILLLQDGDQIFSTGMDYLTNDGSLAKKLCVFTPQYDNNPSNPYLEQVLGSGINGQPDGVAKLTEVVIRLTNTGRKTARKASVDATIIQGLWSFRQDDWCPHGWPINQNGQRFDGEGWFLRYDAP